MTTERRNGMTIKSFGNNKGAAIRYYNNIRMKDYIRLVSWGRDYKDPHNFQVYIIYAKDADF